ncbi:MAG TPA: tetratricopeptide repeat protein [Noviherbaspirillum sp.]
MKNSLLIVTLPLILSACAYAPETASARPFTTPVAKQASQVVAQASTTPAGVGKTSKADAADDETDETLPALTLTNELMFRILGAEFAFQRGEWQPAYVTMLTLAQQTRDPRLARRAAEFAHVARREAEVLSAVRLWRELAPQSDEANQYFLGFVVASDDLSEATPILERRLQQARPQMRGPLAFQFQRLLTRAKDKKAAFALQEQLYQPYLGLAEVRVALALAAIDAGLLERAREEARLALQAKPDSELAVLTLAQATPERQAASAVLTEFLRQQPQARDVRLAHARMLVEDKRYESAAAEFERLLVDDPSDLTSLYALGVLGVQTRNFEAAEKHLLAYLSVLEKTPEQERDPTQALLLLAQIAEERKDNESLLKWLARIESGEAYVTAQIKRAQVIAKRGELAEARELLSGISIGSERDDAMIVMAEGQMLRDANRLDEAMQVYENALERLPDNTDLLYDYAMLAEKNRKWPIMERALRKIIELEPEHHHAYNALGYSFADRNLRLNEARKLIARALELAPDDAFIMDSMGWVEYRLGRLDEAEKLLRRAYQIRPDVEIATHLGEVLWVRGQRAAAEKIWGEAKAKEPQNDTLNSTLARLNVAL